MKLLGIVSTAALSLLLGIAAPIYAQEQHEPQQDQKDQKEQKDQAAKPEAKHAQPEEKKAQQGKPAQQEKQQAQHEKSSQQDKQQAQQKESNQKEKQQTEQKNQQVQQSKQNENKPEHAKQQGDNKQAQRTPEQKHVEQAAWQEHRAKSWQSDHRTWQQRGGYHGYRIPDDRFRGSFGPNHGFRIYGLPFLVVAGYPRFQYSGYWFSPVDPWPEYWAVDWYDTDDVYVTYVDNGYYLFNSRYPNVGIAITISM